MSIRAPFNNNNNMKIKVYALIAYEIRGVKSYQGINFEATHWDQALAAMQRTKDWQYTSALLYHNRLDSKIVGITFNFSDHEQG